MSRTKKEKLYKIIVDDNVKALKENHESYEELVEHPYLKDIIFHKRLSNIEKIIARMMMTYDTEYLKSEDMKSLLELLRDTSELYK